QYVGLGCARLDQIGGKVGGAERRQLIAGDGATEPFQIGGAGIVERVAEGIVRCDEVPFLAVFGIEQIGHRVGFHAGRIADAVDVPVAVFAGNRIGVAAGHDMEDLFLRGDLRDRGGDAGVHIANNEIDVVAFDELAGFLHAGAYV